MRLGIVVLAVSIGTIPLLADGPSPVPVSADTVHVLWRDPGPVEQRDLFWGVGKADRAPKPPFEFIQEDRSGTKPKIEVKDAAGVGWTVKLATREPADNEVHAEIAASRILWALGYFVDENYFVPAGQIVGVKNLRRSAELVDSDGNFKIARFERKAEGAEQFGQWDIEDNRFKGSRELSGLHILMMLLANWDLLTDNTTIFKHPLPGGDVEHRYVVSDLGSTFGRMRGGLRETHTRWNLQDYSESRFIGGVVQQRLTFRNPLMGNTPLAVPVEHARWLVSLLSRLSENQIREAFRASGAPAEEAAAFSTEVLKRIAALQGALSE